MTSREMVQDSATRNQRYVQVLMVLLNKKSKYIGIFKTSYEKSCPHRSFPVQISSQVEWSRRNCREETGNPGSEYGRTG